LFLLLLQLLQLHLQFGIELKQPTEPVLYFNLGCCNIDIGFRGHAKSTATHTGGMNLDGVATLCQSFVMDAMSGSHGSTDVTAQMPTSMENVQRCRVPVQIAAVSTPMAGHVDLFSISQKK
jgi:hypothetical protein